MIFFIKLKTATWRRAKYFGSHGYCGTISIRQGNRTDFKRIYARVEFDGLTAAIM
jgi:hypothetical protein